MKPPNYVYAFVNIILLFLIFVVLGECCARGGKKGGKGDKPNPQNPPPQNPDQNPGGATPAPNPNNNQNPAGASKCLGDGATTTPYDQQGFTSAGGGPVSGYADLKCDFSKPCCWRNEPSPTDQFDWFIGNNPIDDSKFQNCFQTTDKPTDQFMIASSDKGLSPDDNAQFSSCSIRCTKDPIQVTLKHWVTNGVKLQVCQKNDFFDNSTLSGCQDLLQSDQPGPSTYSLPPGEAVKIVIVAKNFVDTMGGTAIIDDLSVKFVPCEESTSGPSGGGGDCNAACNFESSPCNYIAPPTALKGYTMKQFNIVQGQTGNKVTGIRKAAEGNSYAGVELGPLEQAALATDVNLSQDKVIKFQTYDSTDHITVDACCDRQCNYRKGRGVQRADRQWKQVAVLCPKGTQRFSYTATNVGYNHGAVGLDDVQVLNPNGDDPNAATQSSCPAGGAGGGGEPPPPGTPPGPGGPQSPTAPPPPGQTPPVTAVSPDTGSLPPPLSQSPSRSSKVKVKRRKKVKGKGQLVKVKRRKLKVE